MAVVERADSEVVALVGVPLEEVSRSAGCRPRRAHSTAREREGEQTHGISDGVSGLEPGGGRLMKVGCDACVMMVFEGGGEEWKVFVGVKRGVCR